MSDDTRAWVEYSLNDNETSARIKPLRVFAMSLLELARADMRGA